MERVRSRCESTTTDETDLTSVVKSEGCPGKLMSNNRNVRTSDADTGCSSKVQKTKSDSDTWNDKSRPCSNETKLQIDNKDIDCYCIPESAYDLLSKCLHFDPAKRITANDALRHPFLVS